MKLVKYENENFYKKIKHIIECDDCILIIKMCLHLQKKSFKMY